MATKKTKQKLMKRKIGIVMRGVAVASFVVLAIIAVSSLVSAMTLENIANKDGIPSVWDVASIKEPSTITLPITYWDQKADACSDANRQFEWTECDRYRTHGVLMGMVKPILGADRLPIPAFADNESSWAALHDALSINVIGHDPVRSTDNFYRWFHEVPGLSKRINGRTVTFNRVESGVYEYGGTNVFPLDDVAGIDAADVKLMGVDEKKHNFNFTAHLGFSIKVDTSGKEVFQFSGDDDVWVFLNNKLVLDIGGLHGPISGWFRINTDGTVTTFVEKVNNLGIRSGDWVECMRIRNGVYGSDGCIGYYNTKIRENFSDITTENIDFGLKSNDVVNLDFYYAERSTDGSNTKITINHMNWPISADSEIKAKIVGKVDGTENKLVEFNTYVKNRDPENSLELERLAAYIKETTTEGEDEGFLPLDKTTLFYTKTPKVDDSWKAVEISAPDNSVNGFKLATPLEMAPAGQEGDTLYFRYYGETSEYAGTMASTISYYTTLEGNAGITYDSDKVEYDGKTEPSEPGTEPDEPRDEPGLPELPETPTPTGDLPNIPVISDPSDLMSDELIYIAPLGEVAFVPNTGIISKISKSIFDRDFAEVVLSQGFVMAVLLIFAGSFSAWFSLRKYMEESKVKVGASGTVKAGRDVRPARAAGVKAVGTVKVAKTTKSVRATKAAKTKNKRK